MTLSVTIPALRYYTERHVFEHIYKDDKGQSFRPKSLGAITFPIGNCWRLYSIRGTEYVTQAYNAKVFHRLDTLLDSAKTLGGVRVLTTAEHLPLHAWFLEGGLAQQELLAAQAAGSLTVAPLV